jgi:ATP sulfurylase
VTLIFRALYFTPLYCLLTHADWRGVCDGAAKMANGLFWLIPITFSTDLVTAQGIKTDLK